MVRAVVVGAGVAGLAAAVALRRDGWDVEVFEERSREEAHTGSGLVLWPNAQAALAVLGVAEPSTADLGLSLASSDGQPMAQVPATALHARIGGCPRLVLRESLMRNLHDAAVDAGVVLSYGRRLTGAARHAQGWLLELAGGSPSRADVVVGCDGSAPPRAACSRIPATCRASGPERPTGPSATPRARPT